MHKIYVLLHPETEEIRYVGWTKNTLQQRLQSHVEEANKYQKTGKGKTYKNMWVLSLIREGLRPIIRLVEETETPGEAERKWIAHYRSIGARLTNGTDGGIGSMGARWTLTEEQRQALRERPGRKASPEEAERLRQMARGNKAWLGKKLYPETIQKIRDTKAKKRNLRMANEALQVLMPHPPKPPRRIGRGHTGKKHSEETKRLIGENNRRRGKSAATIAKFSASMKGHQVSEETREKIRLKAVERWARWNESGGRPKKQ